MIFFHRTTKKAAHLIQLNGFRDGEGRCLSEEVKSGVFVSDKPLNDNEGAAGEVLLRITVNGDESDFMDEEWVDRRR
jgi:hypothetical protein